VAEVIARARLGFWAALVAALFAAFTTRSEAAPPTVRPFVEFSHRSDLFTGPPFRNPPGSEPTEDSLTFGAELSWPMWRLDVSHGWYSRDCNYQRTSDTARGCAWRSGTRITTRRYFRVWRGE
jgi:hypothetical protein